MRPAGRSVQVPAAGMTLGLAEKFRSPFRVSGTGGEEGGKEGGEEGGEEGERTGMGEVGGDCVSCQRICKKQARQVRSPAHMT